MNGERLRKVVDVVKKQQPDLVVITGDFFNGPVWDENLVHAADELVVELSRLTADCTTLGVLGNHDYWSDAGEARKALGRCGVIEIRNGHYSIERNYILPAWMIFGMSMMTSTQFYPNSLKQVKRSCLHMNQILQI